jgi:hypothetical protein
MPNLELMFWEGTLGLAATAMLIAVAIMAEHRGPGGPMIRIASGPRHHQAALLGARQPAAEDQRRTPHWRFP